MLNCTRIALQPVVLITFLLVSMVANSQTPPGDALSLNGSSQFGTMTIAGGATIESAYTVEAWVMPNSVANGTSYTVFSTRGATDYSFDIEILSGTQIELHIGDISTKTGAYFELVTPSFVYAFTAGHWYHIACAVSLSSYTLYVNGIPIGSGTLGGNKLPLFDASHTLGWVGCNNFAGSYSEYLNGNIDEVRIYNSALTQAQVASDAVNVTSTATLPIAYYNMDAITSNTIVNQWTGDGGSSLTLSGSPSVIQSYAMVLPNINTPTSVTYNSFTANWAAPVNGTVSNYLLDVSTNSNFTSFISGYGGANVTGTTHSVTGLAANTEYYYRVRARNSALTDQGAYSGIDSATTVAGAVTGFTPATASSGQTVTITGVNFTSVTGVSFGGTAAASYTVVNSTTITAVPSTGTSGNVTVIDYGLAFSLSGFTYVPSQPSGTIFIGGSQSICSGSTTTLDATGSAGATYAWYSALTGGTLLSSSSSYTTPALTSNTNYYVQETVSGVTSARTAVTVVVTANATISSPQNVTATPSAICQGQNANLTATVSSNAGQYVYWYDANTGGNLLDTSSSGANFTVYPTATKTYYAQSQSLTYIDTFSYTGGQQTFTVPAGVTSMQIDARGAMGGDDYEPAPQSIGGWGGRVQTTLAVTPGEVLNIYVGARGYGEITYSQGGGASYNGGGATYAPNQDFQAGAGGGATDIRVNGTALSNRVIVAGGGGGAVYSEGCSTGENGGAGGGLTGGSGAVPGCIGTSTTTATGGNQSAGGTGSCDNGTVCGGNGSQGQGGTGGDASGYLGGGGGGGYYGGGGGTNNAAGGGGSSYTDPNLCQSVTNTQGYQGGNGVLVITYTTAPTCGVISTTRQPVTVTVNTTPSVNAPASLNSCPGTSVALTATGTGTTYTWQPGNLSGATVHVSPTTPTTYTVYGIIGSCKDSATVTVTAKSVTASANVTICQGTQATLTATGAADKYSWSPGNLAGASVVVTPSATTTYTLIGSDTTANCNTTAQSTVTINPAPVINAGSNVSVTAGNSVTLTATGNADNYTWSYNNETGASITFVPAATNSYTVTGTFNSTGCTATSQVTVTVLQPPAITGTTTVCPGSTTTITAAGTAPIQWYNQASGGTLLYTGATFTTPVINTDTTYWVSANGSTTVPVNINTVNVYDTASATPANICIGGKSALVVTGISTGFKWYDAAMGGNLLDSIATGSPFYVSPTANKVYYAAIPTASITKTFNLTSSVQTFTVPAGVTSISVDARGARGGNPIDDESFPVNWGAGGIVQATMNVTPGEVLYIYVGGRGYGAPSCYPCDPFPNSGYNGGTSGPGSYNANPDVNAGSGGGGATDIRIGGQALSNRVLVAGGGGGGALGDILSTDCGGGEGGAGGGLTGANGVMPPCYYGSGSNGGGGSQTAGGAAGCSNGTGCGGAGSFGQGGNFGNSGGYQGGGGGGGYYGGGGGTNLSGGGGGSSYYNPYFFTNVVNTQGGNGSNGVLTITYNSAANCTITLPDSVYVNSSVVAPTVTITASSTTVTAGQTVTLSGGGASTYTWNNNVQNGVAFIPDTTAAYQVIGTAANNCTNIDSITIQVLQRLSSFYPTTATQGKTVTITGGIFTGAAAVSFGGTSASSFAVVNDTTITAVVGSGASGAVSVTTLGGVTRKNGFYYGSTPANTLNFDGVNDYAVIPSTVSGDFTIEFWLNTTQTGASAGKEWYNGTGIIDDDKPGEANDYGISLNGTHISFGTGGTSDITVTSHAVVNTGHWVHIAAVRSQTNKTISLYINGVLDTTATAGNATLTAQPNLYIGANRDLSHYFAGSVDELRFFTADRSASVATDMLTTINPNTTNLSAYYSFDENTPGGTNTNDTLLFDLTSKNDTGKVYNAALTGSTSNWIESYAMVLPTATAATARTLTTFTANWTAPAYGTVDNGYRLDVASDSAFVNILSSYNNLTVTSGTSQVVSGLTRGTTYYYRVRGDKLSVTGQGANSNFIAAATIQTPTITSFTPTSAHAYDTVTITGTNFTTVSAVSFGGVPVVYFTAVSDNTIEAVVAGGASGTLSLTTGAGTATQIGFIFIPQTPPGNALNFDGVDDNVTINRPVSGEFTIEYWMRTTQTGGTGSNWYQGAGTVDGDAPGAANDFGTSLLGSKLSFGIGESGKSDVTIVSASNVNTGRWVHVAAVRDSAGGQLKLYINGKLEASATAGTNSLTASTTLKLGQVNSGGGYFNGSLDEVRFFNTDRSASVVSDMLNTLPGNTAGLVTYYNFDEGSAGGTNTGRTTLFDYSSTLNNGTLNNFALAGSSSNWVESYAMVIPGITAATNITGQSFTANWTAPALGTVDNGYRLFVATDIAFANIVTGYNGSTVSGTSATVSGLSGLTKYYYRVTADKSSVTGQGGYSYIDSTTTLSLPTITSFTPTFGYTASTINISGSYFTGATAVSFGGAAASSFTVVNDNQITAVVAGGSTGDITVTAPNGTGSSTTAFTFIAPASISSFAPSSTGTGSTVTINGSGFTGATSVAFGGTIAASYTVVNDNEITAVVASGTTGKITVAAPGGNGTSSATFTFIPAPLVTSFSPSSGYTGISISIGGTYFTGATSVSFGGTPAASFAVVNDNTINAIVANGTSGNISVVTPGGSGTSSAVFTYVPPPSISSFTPSSGYTGLSVTISGSAFTGATAVSFGGTIATSFAVVNDNTIAATVSNGATGNISVTTPAGSVSSSGVFTYIPPVSVASITPSSAGIGSTVTISGTSFTGATSVSLGGAPVASFTVVNDNAITAIVGGGATGDVGVTAPSGTGTLTAGFTFTSLTPPGNALNFDGQNDYVRIPGNPVQGTDFTIEFWMNTTQTGSNGSQWYQGTGMIDGDIPGEANDYGIALIGSKLGFGTGGSSDITAISSTSVNTGHWVYVAAVRSQANSKLSIYINGVLDIQVAAGNTTLSAPTFLNIGALSNLGNYFNGSFDELRFFNSDRSASIVSDMLNTIPASTTGLATYYNFDEGTAGGSNTGITSLVDIGPNKLTAPLSNFALTGGSSNWVESYAMVVPTALSATNITATSFTANWTAPAVGTVTNYILDVSTNAAFTALVTGYNALPVSGTSQIVSGLTSNTQYWFRVRADKTSVTGQGAYSSIVNAATLAIPVITSFTPSSGYTGEAITINGSYFTGATAVSFGGTAATSFTIVNDNQITAVVASGSTGNITVAGVNGTGTSSTIFTFIPAPVISSFTPSTGYTGSTITILGSAFTGANSVTIGGTAAASFAVVTDNEITAVVASGSTGNITIVTPGGIGTSAASFTYIPAPLITSFTPSTGYTGSTISISGSYFTGTTAVSFGGTAAASFTVVNDNTIMAVVANGSTGAITVTGPNGTGTSSAAFTYIPAPTISSFTPSSGYTGETITINGSYFTGATAVSFGGTAATSFTVVNDNQVTAVVASGSTGNIAVTAPNGTGTSSTVFTFIPAPSISSFTPAAGYTGSTITILGSAFIGATSVTIGGTAAASFSVVNDNKITAVVANGSTGNITVVTPGGTGTSATLFTYVPAPLISSFTPSSGYTGSTISISGSYFTGATAVGIGGTPAASFTVVNDNSIMAVVASGSSGNITVTGPNGTGTSSAIFTYIPAPSVSSFTPSSGITGVVITINGSSFTNATAVSFGGTPAASYTVVNDNTIKATVSNGSTGNVLVSTIAGTATSTGVFTYIPPVTITSIVPSSAGIGSIITIHGVSFTGATSVTLGGTATLSFTVVNDTTITAMVGTGATGDVSVTSPVGTGTLPAGFTFTTMAPPGNALNFDGQNDYVRIPGNPVQGKDFTIEFWMNTTQTGFNGTEWYQGQGVLDGDIPGPANDYGIALLSSKIGFGTGGSSDITVISSTSVNTGHWVHVAAVRSQTNSTLSIYINGVLDAQIAAGNATLSAPTFLNLGALSNLNDFFKGSIDELRFFNTDRSASIMSDMLNTIPPSTTGLATYYNFDEGTAGSTNTGITSLIDLGPNNLVAPLSNFALSGGTSNWVESYAMVVPTIAAATNITATGFTANWAAPAIGVVTNYVMDVSTNSNFTGLVTGYSALPVSGTSQNVTGLTANTQYWFRVRADKTSVTGQGAYSATGNATTLTIPVITSFTPSGAYTGQTVTISGSYFTGATAVSFGGTAATSFTVVNDNTITAVVANGSTGNITVTAPNGTGTSATVFTYIPAPSISSFTPSSGGTGSIITIHGSALTGATSVTFGGTAATSFTVVNDNEITATVANGSTGTISIVTPAGTGTSAATFTYLPAPLITSFNPSSGYTGSSISISGSYFTGATSVTFGGTAATSFTVLNDNTINAVVAVGTTGNITVAGPNGIGTSSAVFTYIPAPSITSFSPSAGNTGAVITISGSSFTNTTGVSFGGTPATSFTVVNGNTIMATVSNGSTGNVSVTTTAGSGTSSSQFTYILPLAITSISPTSSNIFGTVTINGAGFTGATSVTFGGVQAASFTVVSDFVITAVVGNGATGDVSVTARGTTVTLPSAFTLITLAPPGNALNFDGQNDYARIPGNPVQGKDFTIEFWIKTTQTGNGGTEWYQGNGIVDGDVPGAANDYGISLMGSKVGFGTGGSSDITVISSTSINTGHWVHVAAVRSQTNSKLSIYINGVLDAQIAAGNATLSAPTFLNIGALTSLGAYFNGSIDELRFFNTDRSASIVSDMLNTVPPSTTGLATYYNFDEGSAGGTNTGGTSLYDLGPNNLTAPLNNFALTGSTSNWVESYAMVVPTALPATSIATTSFTANWTAPAIGIVNNYLLDVSTNASFTSLVTGYNALAVSGTSQNITGLSTGTQYYYRVRSDKSSVTGQGAYSFIISALTAGQPVITAFSPASAYTGETDTVKGAHFSAATSVNFGGTAATSFIVVSDTVITAVVGTGATGNITVTTPGGTAASPTVFTFIPAPVITSFTPSSGYTGETITINGSYFTGATSVSFGGTAAASFTVVNDNEIMAIVGNGSTGNITVVAPNGTGTSTATFTYLPAPLITSFSPSAGYTGLPITINGSYFTGATAVSFGGTPAASFTVVDDNTINAIVASGSTGNVTVTSPNGTGTSTTAFTFILPASITSFMPSAGYTGSTITINGSGFTGATSVTFGGTAATSFTVVNDNKITALVAGGSTGNITVVATAGSGTSSTTFTYIPAPVITSFTPSSGYTGETVTINGSYFTGATAVSFGGTAVASFTVVNDNEIMAIVGSGSTGNITVVAPNGTGTSTATFTYLPAPVITSFSPSAGYAGSPVTINGSYFTGATAVSFGGTPAASFTVVDDNTINAVVASGSTGNVTVTSPYGTGTSSTAFTFIQPASISSFTPSVGYTGSAITINGSGFTGASSVTFGGTAATSFTVVNDNKITAVVAGGSTGNITVAATGGSGTSTTTFIYIPAPVITSFTPSSGYTGETITISGSYFIGTTAVSFGGTAAASFTVVNDNTINAVVASGSTGNITVIAPNGTGTSSALFTYIPAPVITSLSPSSGYTGLSVTISGSYFTGATAVSFGGTLASSFSVVNDNTINAMVAGGSTGTVTVTAPNGTGTSSAVFTYIPAPTITSFSPSSGSTGASVTINGSNFTNTTAVSFGGTPATSFTVLNDNTISATVGNGATGIVSVTTIAGSGASSSQFTYHAPLAITSISPSSTNIFGKVFIYGSGFTGATGVSFGGVPAVAFTVISDLVMRATVGNGATGDVVVTNGTTATLPSAFTLITSPPPGNALNFDGQNDYARISGNPVQGKDFTIEFWMNTTQAGNIGTQWYDGTGVLDGDVPGAANDYGISLIGSKIAFGTGGSSDITVISSTSVNTGHWVHVAAVRSQANSTISIYVNGVLDTQIAAGNATLSAPTFLNIGALTSLGDYFMGSLDELRFFNTDRSASIMSDMLNTIPPSTTGLATYYNFDEGAAGGSNSAGTLLYDSGPNNLTAQLTNFALTGSTSNWVESYAMVVPVIAPTSNITTTGFTASWAAPAVGTVDNYLLDIATDSNFTNLVSGYSALAVYSTSLAATGLTPSSLYYYRIRADKASVTGQGGYTAKVQVYTDGPSRVLSFTPTSALTNTVVTINGVHLSGTTAVTFGGTPAISFTVVSDNYVTAIVGQGSSGSVALTVNGTVDSLNGFTYLTAPTITSFTPATAAAYATVTIKGSSFTSAQAVSFGGIAAASFTVVSDSVINAVVNNGASGNVDVTNLYGSDSLAGFTFTALAPPGNALNFNGSNSISSDVEDNVGYINGSYTVEAWIRPTSTAKMGILSTSNNNAEATLNMYMQSGKLFANFGTPYGGYLSFGTGTGQIGTFNFTSGHWYHIALVVSGSSYVTYVNGVIAGSGGLSSSSAYLIADYPLVIGQSPISTTTHTATHFTGDIDEVRLWSYAATQSQVQSDMVSVVSNPAANSNLLLYYNFDQGIAGGNNTSVNTIYDWSQYQDNGSLNGFNLTGTTSNWVESYAMVIPTATAATNITGSGFIANWTAPVLGAVNNYVLDVSTNTQFTALVAGYNALPVTGTSQAVTGLAQQTTYYYRVRADKASVTGDGAFSNTINLATTVNPPVITSFSPASAAAFDTVTIIGQGFATASAVTFGGTTSASFTIRNDTSILAIVANGSTGSVSVTNEGSSASLAGFTYINNLTPMVPPGNALNFDGVDDYVSISNPLASASNYTIEYWMRTTQTGGTGSEWYNGPGIVDGDIPGLANDLGTALVGTKLAFGTGNPSLNEDITITSKSDVNTGKWVFVTATRNATTGVMKLYINGVLEDSAIAGTAPLAANSTLNIGADNTLGGYFKGSIDEVRMFNTDRSAYVKADMGDTLSRTTAGLAAYYNFDEGVAGGNNAGINILFDQSANKISGTLHNLALSGSTSNWVESYAMVVPTATAASSVTATGFTANWIAPAEGVVNNYLLDVATDSAFSNILPGYNALAVSGTSTSQTVTGLTLGTTYYYRVRADKTSVTGQGGYSNTIITPTIVSYTWVGTISSDWNTPGNWSSNAVPVSTSNVTIPAGTPYSPVISNSTSGDSVNNISISSGAILTISNNDTLSILSNISNAGAINAAAGTVNITGLAPQTINGAVTTNNFIINNTNGATITGGTTTVLGIYTPVAGTLHADGYLVLASTPTGTANVAQGSGNYVSGNVIVERYIPAHRAWRFLTAPVSSSGTIFNNWQNSGNITDSTGVEIWSPSGTGSSGNGLLKGGGAASAEYFDATVNNGNGGNWVGLTNTNATLLSDTTTSAANNALGIFVTGPYGSDRITPATGDTSTTLIATGQLQTGQQVFNYSNIPAGNYILVGNPYASPVNFTHIGATGAASGNILNTMWAWDAQRQGTSYGGYVTFSWDASTGQYDQDIDPGQTAQTDTIQSGQAFFVEADTSGAASTYNVAITFNESDKAIGINTNQVFGVTLPSSQLRIALSRQDGASMQPVDGVLVKYGSNYKAGVSDDANKLYNYDENFALRIGANYLAIERRPLPVTTDTLFLDIYALKKNTNYSFTINPQNINLGEGIQPYVVDTYLNTKTPISFASTNSITFNTTGIAGSYSETRFIIVFSQTQALATTITSLKAWAKDKGVQVEWSVATEQGINQYIAEKSADGITFSTTDTTTAIDNNQNQTYDWFDNNPYDGNNYYRIRVVNKDGSSYYTNVVMVNIKLAIVFKAYPNPVQHGEQLRIEIGGMPAGKYTLQIFSNDGKQVMQKILTSDGNLSTQNINLPTLAAGVYQVVLFDETGKTWKQPLMVN